MTPELRRYLDLEQAMVALDVHGNPEADRIRDMMDGAWRALSAPDRDFINARTLPPLGAELRLTVGNTLFTEPLKATPTKPVAWQFDSWRRSAA